MATKLNDTGAEVQIQQIKIESSTFALIGTTPMIQNRLPEKARMELLMPKGRRTVADKANSLKHDPLAEFRSSIHRMPADAPTLIGLPASAVKKAIASAALDIPGAKKTQIGRLTYVVGDVIPVFGIPKTLCSIVRSADMNKTPDVRTRGILPEWAMIITVQHPASLISTNSLANLLTAAGSFIGLGDWRSEKGAGNYGSFAIADENSPAFKAILEAGGRDAQTAAMADPEAYNEETDELLEWFHVELKRKGFKVAA